MSSIVKVSGIKEKYVSRSITATRAIVKCVNLTDGSMHEKRVDVVADIETASDMHLFLMAEKDKYLAIHTKDASGKSVSFIGVPVEVKSMEHVKKQYKISYSNLLKYGVEVTKEEAEKLEAEEAARC